MNLLLFSTFLAVAVIFGPFFSVAQTNIKACSPSNTNIDIDARIPGVISTPVFPDGYSSSTCTWKIQAPDSLRLAITIDVLQLSGQDDHLVIRDGASSSSPLIGKYGPCASGSVTLYSSGSSAFLQTVSPVFSSNNHLKITFKPTNPDDIDCSKQAGNPPNFCSIDTELRELSGVLSSPNFPNNYDADETCLWTIIAPQGYRVQFILHWFGIESHRYSRPGSCMDDKVTISDAHGSSSKTVATLCGCQQLVTHVSYNEKLWLKFSSYKKNNLPGFYVTYQALSPEECPAGDNNCPIKSMAPVGFDAQGQVCSAPVSVVNDTLHLDEEAKIEVVCKAEYIEATMKKEDFPGLEISSLHLKDESCGANYVDDQVVRFTFGLEECGTVHEDDGERIIYKQKISFEANEKSDDDAITRKHSEVILFQCAYDKKRTISKISYNPRTTKVITDADGYGNFTYELYMYESEDMAKKVEDFPYAVGLGLPMYFGFKVTSGDSELNVFPDVCKATAGPEYDSKPDHIIIENACSRDNTLNYDYMEKAEHSFSVAAFRFKRNYDDVYIHCKLTICRDSDTESRCARGCEASKRKRRSLEDDMSANLHLGPLRLKTMNAGKQNDAAAESSNSMVMLVAVLVGVLGAVAIGLVVAVVIVGRRRRYAAVNKGVGLIVAEDM